jgi:hypothetical protein
MSKNKEKKKGRRFTAAAYCDDSPALLAGSFTDNP